MDNSQGGQFSPDVQPPEPETVPQPPQYPQYPAQPQYALPGQYAVPPAATRNPNSKGRCVGRSIIPPVLHMGIQLIISIIIGLIFIVVAMLPSNGSFSNAFDYNDMMDFISGDMLMLIMCVSGGVSILVFALMYSRMRRRFEIAKPRERASLTVVPLIVVFSVGANLLLVCVLSLIQTYLPFALPTSSLDNMEGSFWPTLLAVGLIAPIAEELCFRALSFNQLRRGFAFAAAAAIQAAWFGIIHMIPVQIAYAFVFGWFLGWLYERSGRLSFAIISHIAFNSGNILISFLLSGGEVEDLVFFIILGVSLVVTAAGLIVLSRLLSASKANKA